MTNKYKLTICFDGKQACHAKLATKRAANFVKSVLITVGISLRFRYSMC